MSVAPFLLALGLGLLAVEHESVVVGVVALSCYVYGLHRMRFDR